MGRRPERRSPIPQDSMIARLQSDVIEFLIRDLRFTAEVLDDGQWWMRNHKRTDPDLAVGYYDSAGVGWAWGPKRHSGVMIRQVGRIGSPYIAPDEVILSPCYGTTVWQVADAGDLRYVKNDLALHFGLWSK